MLFTLFVFLVFKCSQSSCVITQRCHRHVLSNGELCKSREFAQEPHCSAPRYIIQVHALVLLFGRLLGHLWEETSCFWSRVCVCLFSTPSVAFLTHQCLFYPRIRCYRFIRHLENNFLILSTGGMIFCLCQCLKYIMSL